MNSSLLPYLASPIEHRPLELASPDQLKEVNGTAVFPIVEGIPLLQPPGQFAEWYCECLEVIFQERTAEIFARIAAPTGEVWAANLRQVLREDYGADGIREAFRSYANLSRERRMAGFVHVLPSELSVEHPLVQRQAIESRRQYAGLSYSRQHFKGLKDQERTWAFHLSDYAAAVFAHESELIVELGTGAGLGTGALIETGVASARLITIDVDYGCIGNAEGLAKVLGLEKRVDGIVASFWFLPFPDGSVDVVCSHNGIDESRETSRILAEVSRVLRDGGRFVAVCRSDGAFRLSMYLDALGFCKEELRAMAIQADIYPGTDRLIEIAAQNGLVVESRQTIKPDEGHQRDILVLRKQPHAQ